MLSLETSFLFRCLEIFLFHTAARVSTTGYGPLQDFARIPKSESGRGVDQEYGPVLQIVIEKGHFQRSYL